MGGGCVSSSPRIPSRSSGYDVTVARNGHLALECAFEVRPDIILMDVHMPGMNGIDAIRLLRDHPLTVAVPILAVTAQAMAGDREKVLAVGATDYLSKPFTLRDLAAKVALMLKAQATADPE
jgi:CheY-like chemotaxis protein